MAPVMPEILVEVRGLSPVLLVIGLLAGLLLWLGGWWSYRFWAVLGATVIAGIVGLQEAPHLRIQPVVASVLLALSAGMLALSLARLFAFASGGLAAVILVPLLSPSAHAPIVCFLAGGLLATLLFRLWMILLTSLSGTVLLVYCILGLISHVDRTDLASWSRSQPALFNWIIGIATGLGWLVQLIWTHKRARPKEAKKEEKKPETPRVEPPPPPPRKRRTIWAWVPFRKAA
jgi:hypothetical protein